MSNEETFENIGKSIHVFNDIELFINLIINHHVEPKNEEFFLNYILNTSVISFGSKIKILINLNVFSKSQIAKIRDYSANRNVFAHSNRNPFFIESVTEDLEKNTVNILVDDVIFKTNSEGKLIKMNYKEFIKQHVKLQNEMIDLISNYIKENNINTYGHFIENLILKKQ